MTKQESVRNHPRLPSNQPFQLKGDKIRRSRKRNAWWQTGQNPVALREAIRADALQ
jgi:hypothetical protein